MKVGNLIALRIDDIGSSSKRWEVYGKVWWKIGSKHVPFPPANWLFLKYIPPFKQWGPYREMAKKEWFTIFDVLEKCEAKMTVGVTACWVEKNGALTLFPKKFPDEAEALKEGVKAGLIEVANHGLTHCVVGKHTPRSFSSNRLFHREFYNWLPDEIHYEHMKKSQEILIDFFGKTPITFIPPGNVWTDTTEKAAYKFGIKYLSATENKSPSFKSSNSLIYIGTKHVIAMHDREIITNRVEWFIRRILELVRTGMQITSVESLMKKAEV